MSSWTPLDLGPYLRGEMAEVKPQYLTRQDGTGMLYARHVHWISGEPEGMKSWLAQIAIAEQLKASERPNVALYVDFESDIGPIISRFLALGVPKDRLQAGLIYVRPDEPFDDPAQTAFIDLGFQPEISLLDGINAGMGQSGMDPNSSKDFNHWWGRLGRSVELTTTGPTLAVDHVTKDPLTRGPYPLGTGSKLAVTDVHIGVDVVSPFGHGLSGRARLVIKKDRPGWLRGAAMSGRNWGELLLTSDLETGAVTYQLEPAGSATGADGSFRPTVLMERISRFLEGMTEPLSGYAISNAVPGKREYKLTALKVLAAEGYVSCRPGPRGGLLYQSQKAFREDAESTGSPPVPNRFPERVGSDRFPGSSPLQGGTGGNWSSKHATGSPDQFPVGVASPNGSRELAYADLADEDFVDALHEVQS